MEKDKGVATELKAKEAEEHQEQEGSEEVKVKLRVVMFARARELAGGSEFDLVVKEGATTADCVGDLIVRFPVLDSIRDSIVVAVNYEYVTDPVIVKDGDELAIIPPISGG